MYDQRPGLNLTNAQTALNTMSRRLVSEMSGEETDASQRILSLYVGYTRIFWNYLLTSFQSRQKAEDQLREVRDV